MKKKIKARLIQNVYCIEIDKMRDAGLSYKKIAKELSIRHKKHFSTGWVYENYRSASQNRF
ncbi:MAG: hypothetical protein ACYDDE_07015 [bacterium]